MERNKDPDRGLERKSEKKQKCFKYLLIALPFRNNLIFLIFRHSQLSVKKRKQDTQPPCPPVDPSKSKLSPPGRLRSQLRQTGVKNQNRQTFFSSTQ